MVINPEFKEEAGQRKNRRFKKASVLEPRPCVPQNLTPVHIVAKEESGVCQCGWAPLCI
jgi:hypothetical protein